MSVTNFSPAEELAAIGWAREDLYDFSRWMFLKRHGYKWIRGNHHQAVCAALTRVFEGHCKYLIINIPPRYSKTELAMVNFVPWALGKVPDAEFIHTSYSGRLATNNSWQARELVLHEAYRQVFPNVVLRDDSQAKDEWRTTLGGCVYAVGAGGTLTGYGAGKLREGFTGAIIIDDPHKPDEARSDTVREGMIEWYQNTLQSRRNSPETPIIVIMQRLHERDLAGWLLAGGDGHQWECVMLPAIQEDGTALWPEKHTLEELQRMQEAAPYMFAGQYQQSPSTPEGNLFRPDNMEVIDALPQENIKWCRGWDLGATVNGNYTVGVKIGRRPNNKFIVAHVNRLRRGPDERDAALKNTAMVDGPTVRQGLPQDPGQAGKTQALYLTRLLAGYPVFTSPESGDKITRAEPFASQINVGNVQMVRGEWNQEYTDELRLFPNGQFDDQVDASSRAFEELMISVPLSITQAHIDSMRGGHVRVAF